MITRAPMPRWRRLSRAMLFAAVVVIPLGIVAFLVRTKFDPLVSFDQDVIVGATDITRDNPALQDFAHFFEILSQPWVMYLFLGLPVCLVVWLRHDKRTRAWWGIATMAVGWGLAAVLKLIVGRARPEIDDPFAQHAGYSFPSGHATNNAVVVTAALVLLWPALGTLARRVLSALAVTWVLLVCLDRVFMGAHSVSDVATGVLLGVGLVAASYAGYLGWSPPTPTSSEPDSPTTATLATSGASRGDHR